MKQSLLIAAGVIVSIAAACSGPDFQTDAGGSGGVGGSTAGGKGSGGSLSGKGGSSSSGGSAITNGGTDPGTGGSQGQSGGAQAGGGSGMCTDTNQCGSSSSPCVITYCDPVQGCILEPVVDGPLTDDVPGDCRYLACEGGEELLVEDPNDFDDRNECTTDACSTDGAVHNNSPGVACAGGICDDEGVCRQCNVAACPVATECMMPMCGMDGCQLVPRPRGTLCQQNSNQCDGEGNCLDCVDNGGCEDCCVCTGQNVCIQTP
jgi:hypothetical protein